MPTTYFPNRTSYLKFWIKDTLRWVIPYWIKTPLIMHMSDDKRIAVEKVGYMFGWKWKKWRWAKLTGRIFKIAQVQPPTPEAAQDHYARTGEDLMKPKEGNIIVYCSEDFMPYEFEPYMTVNLRP